MIDCLLRKKDDWQEKTGSGKGKEGEQNAEIIVRKKRDLFF